MAAPAAPFAEAKPSEERTRFVESNRLIRCAAEEALKEFPVPGHLTNLSRHPISGAI